VAGKADPKVDSGGKVESPDHEGHPLLEQE
jgi:hypothetical protein